MASNTVTAKMEETFASAMTQLSNNWEEEYLNDDVMEIINDFKQIWITATAEAMPAPVVETPASPVHKSKKKKTTTTTEAVAEPPKAKRAPSKYNLFVQDMKADIVSRGFKGKELMKEAARLWNEHKATLAVASPSTPSSTDPQEEDDLE